MAAWLAACGSQKGNGLPPLRETFSKADRNPFGAYIAYRQLEAMYFRNNINAKTRSFDKTWNEISDTASLYVCISPAVYLNEDEIDAMMNYVSAGNTLFIAAAHIDADLLKRIDCKEEFNNLAMMFGLDSLRNTTAATTDSNFAYFYYPFRNSFSYTDTVFTKTIGYNDDGVADFIMYYHGKGRLILHCDPRAFSNYFLLKGDNYKFLQQAFSFTNNRPDHVYWDEYYRRQFTRRPRTDGNDESGSSLSEIMKHPPLKTAFWLCLAALLLYVLFGIKRRQRIIEKIKPNENTTVTFTETIGRLYLQKKDNKNIAEKMITYFNEHVRNNYYMNYSTVNEDFITTLSRKSGVDRVKVEALYSSIQQVNNSSRVDDSLLMSLHNQLQQFYKK
ncbi:MAG: DUF4350 domain-containing protein [Ferruginibacter sp.]